MLNYPFQQIPWHTRGLSVAGLRVDSQEQTLISLLLHTVFPEIKLTVLFTFSLSYLMPSFISLKCQLYRAELTLGNKHLEFSDKEKRTRSR